MPNYEHGRQGRHGADGHRRKRPGVVAAPPNEPAKDRHQQTADKDVVGNGQRVDDVLQHACDDHHQDPESRHVEPIVPDVVVLATRLDVALEQPRNDVLAEHRRGGDQRAAGRGHHRGERRREHQAGQHRRQLHLDELGERVVAGLQRRQQNLGRHPDHRAGHRVQQAVHARSGAGPARHPRAAGGEHPLPDVLADQQSEGVDDEVGQDRLAADRGQRSGVAQAAFRPGRRIRRSCTARPAAG